MKKRQRHERDISIGRGGGRRWMQPRGQLQAGGHETPMRSDDRLGHARRAATHQHDGWVVRLWSATEVAPGRCVVAPDRCAVLEAVLKPHVARLELDAMALLLFLDEREQHAKQRRQIFLDIRGDDPLDGRLRLKLFQPLVERCQRDDHLDACRLERLTQFACGVERIQRQHAGTRFPRPEFRNQKLRRVRQQQCHTVALDDACLHEPGSKSLAQPIEVAVRNPAAFEKDGSRLGLSRCGFAHIVDERL